MSSIHRALAFLTSNPNKAHEVAHLLGRQVDPLPLDVAEIQGSCEEIAIAKLEAARRVSQHDLIATEDVALGYDDLGGFPGPYVKSLLETAGGEGLAKLGEGLESRAAHVICTVALWDGSDISLHSGEVPGTVLRNPRGEGGFGWDAWFLPSGSDLTYAEMSPEEKGSSSHRSIAWRKVARHLRQLDR